MDSFQRHRNNKIRLVYNNFFHTIQFRFMSVLMNRRRSIWTPVFSTPFLSHAHVFHILRFSISALFFTYSFFLFLSWYPSLLLCGSYNPLFNIICPFLSSTGSPLTPISPVHLGSLYVETCKIEGSLETIHTPFCFENDLSSHQPRRELAQSQMLDKALVSRTCASLTMVQAIPKRQAVRSPIETRPWTSLVRLLQPMARNRHPDV